MAKSLSADLVCIKYITLLVNLLFLITGAFLIGFGAYAMSHGVDGLSSVTISALIITLGCLVFIVSAFGCLGAAKENRGLLMVYSTLVLIFILIEIALGITAWVKRDDIPELADNNWSYLYDHDRAAIERIEQAFGCCGWFDVYDRAVPPRDDADTERCVEVYPDFANDACEETVTQTLEDGMVIAGITAISVAVFQLICLLFSCCLYARLPTKKQKEEALLDEARRLNRDHSQTNYQTHS